LQTKKATEFIFLSVKFEASTAVTMKNAVFWDDDGGAKFLRNFGYYKSHTA
jgi:hypothetical protein